MDRREFLKSAATATAAIPFGAFISRVEARGARGAAAQATYGPLAAVADETTGLPLLMLPAGFRYLSLGWTGDVMSSGSRPCRPRPPALANLLRVGRPCLGKLRAKVRRIGSRLRTRRPRPWNASLDAER